MRPERSPGASSSRRQRLHPIGGPLRQLHEIEQLYGATPGFAPREAEVAPVDEQVLQDAQLVVECVRLRDHASRDRICAPS